MNPLILQFKETPEAKNIDYSQIEYSDKLNLSLNRLTKEPAIDSLNLETETMTKADVEASDSDLNRNIMSVETMTGTFTNAEASDSDKDRFSLQMLMDTTTITESSEPTDQDKNWK